MKYSLNWIQKYTNISADLSNFLEKMAIDGFETEGIEVFDLDKKIVVAKIRNIKKHPNADKLNLCQVVIGLNKYQIVCGANNLYPDMLVALAQINSKLPNGAKIKKSKIRDIVSEGMLCSASELGLSNDSEGILDLTKDIIDPKVLIIEGELLANVLGLPDRVIDFNITPNRGYCLSHLALAQEIAILNEQKYHSSTQKTVDINLDKNFKVEVQEGAQKSCPKYLARFIAGIEPNQTTPAYITSALKKCGLNCINPVVDILNYVMLEMGQPMHAFDSDQVKGNITVRYSNSTDNKIQLINQDTVEIKQNTLLICDETTPIALAGVMGGIDSAVQTSTSNILLECAYFDAVAIAGKARAFNLSSDAAYRYERNVDFNLAEIAIERASEIIIKHLSGKASKVFSAISETNLPQLKEIELSFEKVNQVLGLSLNPREIVEMLSRISDVEYSENSLSIIPPSNRFDLRIQEDLIEEVVRIYGYQKINSNQVKVTSSGELGNQFNQKRIRDFWADRGFNEVINYSFIHPEYHQILHPNIEPIPIKNPISKDKSVIRYSLFSGLIVSFLQNQKYQNPMSKFFEIGACFDLAKDNLYIQKQKIAGLISGSFRTRSWNNPKREVDFYDLKGDLESLFELSGSQIYFETQNEINSLHPNQSAKLVIKHKNKISSDDNITIGYIGYLNPNLVKKLEINQDILVFEFDLDQIINKPALKFKPFSRQPQVKRDLAFLVTEDITGDKIHQSIDSLNIKDLKSYQIFDVYQDIKSAQKSIAVEFCFQSSNKTLKDKAIQFMLQKIIEQLEQDLQVKFRDF